MLRVSSEMAIWLPLSKAVSIKTSKYPSLRLYHTCPTSPSPEEPFICTNSLRPSWDWQPGMPLLTTPKGTICLASYMKGTPKAYLNRTGIHREWWATEEVLITKGIKVSTHLQWPSHWKCKSNFQVTFEKFTVPFCHWLTKQSLMIGCLFLPQSANNQPYMRPGTSLVFQWLRLLSPNAGAQCRFLVEELDPTCHN